MRQCKRGDSERDRRKRTLRSRETKGTDAEDGAVWPVWARSEKPRHEAAEIKHGGSAAAVELGDFIKLGPSRGQLGQGQGLL